MPVTTTESPDLLRVSFPLSESGKGLSIRNEAEVVCFMRLVGTKFEILYAYHLIRTRSGNIGPFDHEKKVQYKLTTSLVASIEHCVKEEYWSCFSQSVLPLPFDGDDPDKMSDEEIEVAAS